MNTYCPLYVHWAIQYNTIRAPCQSLIHASLVHRPQKHVVRLVVRAHHKSNVSECHITNKIERPYSHRLTIRFASIGACGCFARSYSHRLTISFASVGACRCFATSARRAIVSRQSVSGAIAVFMIATSIPSAIHCGIWENHLSDASGAIALRYGHSAPRQEASM